MIEIISHTPIWVFVLFFLLVIVGLFQLKDRNVSLQKATILPISMVCLSFYGLISAFGLEIKSIFCWLVGLIIAVLLNLLLKLPKDSTYDKKLKIFFIKGSIIPFILIMIIFFTKYSVAVVIAKHLAIL
ncbi:MAG: hypothetical protein EOM78_19575, partial [Erysipelotrichia bacterium]|nr:hypothetical protein [Erysipelotrichia bacterium]